MPAGGRSRRGTTGAYFPLAPIPSK